MVRRITTAFYLLLFTAATIPATAQKKERRGSRTAAAKHAPKFLDTIEIPTGGETGVQSIITVSSNSALGQQLPDIKVEDAIAENSIIETASSLQLKYAVLLNTDVEAIENNTLFSAIDEWYGTRYELGGNSKAGIDCSAFVQAVYAKLFQISIPRTTREQHKAVRAISRTELKQGDLVFFNTRGGISHVGIYLQNNKFVHAATSGGVMVSDLFEDYWVKRFMGAGRYETKSELQPIALKP